MTKMTEGKKHKEKAPVEDSVPHDDTVGEALRAARVAKGKTIEDVAAALRIRHTQLRAIEENNIGALPGITYAVGFVRSYANYLGLNGAEMVNRFKTQHGFSPAQSKLDFPEPVAESRMPDPLIIGVGAFLAILVLAVWTFYSSMESASVHQAEQIQPAPVETATAVTPAAPADAAAPATATTPDAAAPVATAAGAAPATAPADAAMAPMPATPPAQATDAAATTAPAGTTPAPAVVATVPASATAPAATPDAAATPGATTAATVTPAAPQVADAAAPAAAEPAKEAQDEKKEEKKEESKKKDKAKDDVIEVKRGKSRVTLRANQASWVQVTNASGDVIFKKVLRPGETYMVPDQAGMSLVTSNAGGLDITVDGQKVQAVGAQGEIVRGVELDAASLKKKRTKAY